ncbi:MAG: ATP-binding cassette subfamily B protein [Polaribacter sp.]|jgi:ATP-binding cassette subfamily B protein|tara:strand:- start:1095 stop:2732 length:1638 start_codon:yes stop_codon:yes gene_type:complete
MIKLIVDAVTNSSKTDFSEVIHYILVFGGIQLLQAILQNYRQLISETQQQLVSDYMSEVIIDKAVDIDISYYENAAYHNTFHQAQKQALYRPVQILNNLTEFLSSTFLLISLAGLLFFLHWGIALILICFALPIAGVKWYYSRKLYEWERNRTELEREAAYLNHVLTSDSYAKEVRIFNLGEILKKRFTEVRKALFGEKFKINNQRAKAGVLAKSTEIIAMVLTYGYIAWSTFKGNSTIGDLVMYFQAFQKGQSAIQQLLQSVVGLYSNRLFLSHLFELLEVESLVKPPEKPIPLQNLENSIRLENVDFVYPNTEKKVLKNINLELKKGQIIAFVGENGSGKTTLIKLLCKLYHPNEGKILWDKIDFKNTSLSDLRQRISVIYQDFAKYQFSIGENIQIGDLASPLSEPARQSAAEKSGALRFIDKFPKGYDQILGGMFKKGSELSGGQWQKIALARAFYKDAEIIILDEPSSSIDPLAEAEIFEHFKTLAKDKILILVTHRLYNLKIADKIVVLNNGEIVEEGTHLDLVEKKGLYSEMFEKQVS